MRSLIDLSTGKPFTRRDACKGLAAIIAAGCAPNLVGAEGVSATGMRRGLAARVGMMGGDKLTAKSYVQDGLIAMWDGIENAGWGVHDASATTWKNLAKDAYHWSGVLGGYDIGEWSDDAYYFSKQPALGEYTTQDWNMYGVMQIEVCYKKTGGKGAILILNKERNPTIALATNGNVGVSVYPSFAFGYGSNYGTGCNISDNVAFSISGALSATKLTTAYLNAQEISIVPVGYNYGWYRDFATFGRDNDNNSLGYLYCCRCYSRNLSSTEVAHNYAVDAARFGLA